MAYINKINVDGVEYEVQDENALPAADLPEAINTALAQAKESGEFDGAQGPAGPAGEDYVLTETDKQEIAELAAELVPSGGGGASEEKWRLIYSGETTEVLNTVEVTQDLDGNAFNLKKMYVSFENTITAGTKAQAYVYLRNEQAKFVHTATCDIGVVGSTRQFHVNAETLLDGIWRVEAGISNGDSSGSSYFFNNMTLGSSPYHPIEHFTGFRVAGYGTGTWDKTKVFIYGVDA